MSYSEDSPSFKFHSEIKVTVSLGLMEGTELSTSWETDVWQDNELNAGCEDT